MQSVQLDTLGIALFAILDTKELVVPLVPQDTTLPLLPALLAQPSTATASPAAVYLPVPRVQRGILARLALIAQADIILAVVVASSAHPSTVTAFNAPMSILVPLVPLDSLVLLALAVLLDTLETVQSALLDTKELAVLLVPQDSTPLHQPVPLALPLIVTASPVAEHQLASLAQLATQPQVCV